MSPRALPSKLFDLVFLTRPALLWASAAFFFAGVISGFDRGVSIQPIGQIAGMLPNLGLFLIMTASAFVINQVFDVETDSLNRKAFIIPTGLVRRYEALILGFLLYLVVILISFRLSPLVKHLVWLGAGLGLAYSLPPIRLKARPVADLLANVAGFGVIGFTLGRLTNSPSLAQALVAAFPYSLAMAAIFINTCIADEEGDRMAGDRTICVVFGSRKVSRVAVVMLGLAGLVGALEGEILLWLAATAAMPAFVGLAVEPTRPTSLVASRVSAIALLALVTVRIPIYGLGAIGIYLVSSRYYRWRFNLKYPSLSPSGD